MSRSEVVAARKTCSSRHDCCSLNLRLDDALLKMLFECPKPLVCVRDELGLCRRLRGLASGAPPRT
eukprot:scaffold103465_cov38-Tisochrysis_lutea.AAC.1